MTTPTVVEIPRALEPTGRDTFLATDDAPSRPVRMAPVIALRRASEAAAAA